MANALAKHYSFGSLIVFALPSMAMMLFISLYSIVDGFFVSNFVGTDALSAVNMVMPLFSLAMGLSIMLAAGGSATIAKRMGEGCMQHARQIFTSLVIIEACVGTLLCIVGSIFCDNVIVVLGANDDQMEYCRSYLSTLLILLPFCFLQMAFQSFFVTAGKPSLGLIATGCAGVANMVLDYVFIAVLGWGIAGAAWATGIGFMVPSVFGLLFFGLRKGEGLRFCRPRFEIRTIIKACTNGSSEMVGNLAEGLTTYLFNIQAMALFGTDGVSAITAILYFNFVFSAVFFGYSSGIAPIVSFKYGARDTAQLASALKSGLVTIGLFGIVSFTIARFSGPSLMLLLAPADSPVYALTLEGFPLFSPAFLFMGFTFFLSAMFTAVSDGRSSAVIAFMRSFVFLAGMLVVMPTAFGGTGLWLAMPIAEALGALVALSFLVVRRRIFGFSKSPTPA